MSSELSVAKSQVMPKLTGFETTRLRVQHWGARLADTRRRAVLERDLAAILTPPVLQPLPPSLQRAPGEGITRWIDDRAAESDVLTIHNQRSGVLLGILILAHPPGAGTISRVHLGYLLAESAWGCGYATELVTGLILATGAGVELVGGVACDNPASARVLEKAGFVKSRSDSTPETDVFVWPSSAQPL